MRSDLPAGTVTLLLTDIEGSTRLLHELGPERYAEALAEHRRILRGTFAAHGGAEVDTQGDAFFYAFPTAVGAVLAAMEGRDALLGGPIRVRMGLHTGTPHRTEEGYVGSDVHRAARVAAAGHGGQVLLTRETFELVEAEVTDLGEHRLKDFDRAVPIFQLGRDRFPPLKTLSNTNLPRPASELVGRTRELDEIRSRLRGRARLLTLTGPGGSGKTRLAVEVAAELVPSFKAGVFWIGLAQLRDPSLVLPEIGRILGASESVAEHVGEREMLLLVDNLEQVIEAAPDLAALVEACPNLHLLVTSRERLRVRGEAVFAVPPLARAEAAELFRERSGLEPDDTVAELCRRLDDMPLAVELAAARASVLSPAKILERLAGSLDLLTGGRDADPRQATLRATIAWSHDLLPEPEQRLFAALSVFAGCTLEAAEEIAGADLDGLQSLVDKSLLRQTEDRFWLLETIRAFAAERLADSGAVAEVRARHAEHYSALVEETAYAIQRPVGDPVRLDRIELEHDNLRAALDHLEEIGDGRAVQSLAATLGDFWAERGHLAEGLARLRAALELDPTPSLDRARAMTRACMLAGFSDDAGSAVELGERALEELRRLNEPWETARALHSLGYAIAESGDWERARALFEDGALAFSEAGDEGFAAWMRRSVAWTLLEVGDLAGARAAYEQALDRARSLGEVELESATLGALALLAVDDGRMHDGLALLREHLGALPEDPDRYSVAESLARTGRALVQAGSPVEAVTLAACSEGILEELGTTRGWVDRMKEETTAMAHAELDEVAIELARERGRRLTVDAALQLAFATLDRADPG